MILLTIEGQTKDVANTLDEIKEFFKAYSADQLKDPSNKDKDDPSVIKAYDPKTKTELFFKFEKPKLERLIKLIMPSLRKKKKEDDPEETDES